MTSNGDYPPVRAFGVWDAPATDDAEWLTDTPTEMRCMHCQQHFLEGDNGAIMPNGLAQHRECALRSVMGGIGHAVDHVYFCRGLLGPDAGLPYRASALLLWEQFHGGTRVTRELLLALNLNSEESL